MFITYNVHLCTRARTHTHTWSCKLLLTVGLHSKFEKLLKHRTQKDPGKANSRSNGRAPFLSPFAM